jgi:restriction system protein
MEFPGYQDFMLPLLRLAGDQREHRLRDATQSLGDHFELTAEQRAEVLPSGEQTKLGNRVQWASTYLTKSGLLTRPARGRFQITDLGLKVLAEKPPTIDNRFLRRFPGFVEFIQSKPPASAMAGQVS